MQSIRTEFNSRVKLQQGVMDKWKWGFGKDGSYKVNEVYGWLARQEIDQEATPMKAFEDVWSSCAILKAKILVWRVLRGRLPVILAVDGVRFLQERGGIYSALVLSL